MGVPGEVTSDAGVSPLKRASFWRRVGAAFLRMWGLWLVGFLLRFPWPYYIGLVAAAALLVDHWRLIRTRKREDCFRAFRRSHWIGAAVFGGILLPRVLHEIR